MRVVAILEVDTEKLAETGHSFEEEMGWAVQSGITLREYKEVGEASDYEYAAFVWNTDKQGYEQAGRSVTTERLCRERFAEYVEKGWFMNCYDTNRVVFKRRLISNLYTKWEEIKEVKDDRQ